MITHLSIENFILIEKANIPLGKGLNVLTGETGAGKSSVVKALSFLLGERSPVSVIRKGASKAIVEGVFELHEDHFMETFLNDTPCEHEFGQPLILHRELLVDGKSKAFINGKRVQLNFLQKVGKQLIEFSGQSASEKLSSLDAHREIFDAFSKAENELDKVAHLFEKIEEAQKEVRKIEAFEPNRLRRIDQIEREIAEIDDAAFTEEEEQALFQEYKNFSSAYDIQSLLEGISQRLEVFDLPFVQRSLDRLTQISGAFSDQLEVFSSIKNEVEDFSFEIEKLKDDFPFDPTRQEVVHERLEKLNGVRRKYGKNEEEINAYRAQIGEELKELQNSSDKKEALLNELINLERLHLEACRHLSKKREASKPLFEKALSNHLGDLNFAQAKGLVDLRAVHPGSKGQEEVELLLEPNPGEPPVSLKDKASGGERSRAMLALHLMLAEKGKTPTLLFDEIDVGLGGRAAAFFAEKCVSVSGDFQILCITHQPQIAEKGHAHITLEKQSSKNRTQTIAQVVQGKEREEELSRMRGETLVSA